MAQVRCAVACVYAMVWKLLCWAFFFDMSLSVSCIFYWFGSDVVCGRVGISVCVVD